MNNNAIEMPGNIRPTKGTKIDGKYAAVIVILFLYLKDLKLFI